MENLTDQKIQFLEETANPSSKAITLTAGREVL